MGTKISALPGASALTGFETLPGVQSLADVGITANQLKTFVLAAVAAVGLSGSAADLVAGTLAVARLPALSGGDVTSSSGSATLSIGANKVTRGMLAATAAAAILGATAAGNVADLTAAQVKAILALTDADIARLGSIQTASYTAAIGDANTMVRMNSGSAMNFTVPPNSSVAFPLWSEINIAQAGVGGVTFVAGAGVTINSRGGLVTIAGQYGAATLKKVASPDTWLLVGDLA